jgi:hypothetical protein
MLLIDGHNLIGQLAAPRLDDPDDEAQLVRRLRSYRADRSPGSPFAMPASASR